MLTGKQRTFLRAEAHLLEAVVQIGKFGVTEAAIRQISEQLRAHELIKVRFAREAPIGAREAGAEVAAQSESELVQCTGRIIVLYRQHDKKPKIALPGSKAALLIESEQKRDPRLSLRRRHADNRKRKGTRGTRSTGSGKPAREVSASKAAGAASASKAVGTASAGKGTARKPTGKKATSKATTKRSAAGRTRTSGRSVARQGSKATRTTAD